MKQNLVIIDGNAIGHACHHATKLSVGSVQTQAVYGFVRIIREIQNTYADRKLIVLWDGEAKFRFDLHPGYKGKRRAVVTDPEKIAEKSAYYQQTPLIKKAVESFGIDQMIDPTLEADDLAGWLVSLAKGTERKITLVTGDTDWLQLVNANVMWFDPREGGKRVDITNFLEMTGYFSPSEYLQGKCLVGDSTDDIPPVGGIGEKSAPELLAQFRSIPGFWAACDSGQYVPTKKPLISLWKGTSPFTKEEWALQLPELASDTEVKAHMNKWPGQGRLNFIRNLKLMKLINAPAPLHLEQTLGKLNLDIFKLLCERLLFNSILKEFSNFTRPFQK